MHNKASTIRGNEKRFIPSVTGGINPGKLSLRISNITGYTVKLHIRTKWSISFGLVVGIDSIQI